ncbi:DNA adenine methylase [Rhodoferax sp.]|uniref:DNA adenine methylase n=1 Tax=Rhodoferax sp. TaxID=50421 RepID=UPI002731C2C8|nr:DNA adenine methylase [Rhodoferax sp.]MDP1527877.1 DNA adenine methylase [Rhodoferax sp.]MDP1944510.1 DNA adenine methylase [Rhodoferax sp.]MDP2440158.1 DNA adenine methylase [Rhodoferax sp.]MDZ4208868.1 DNA adenine methylase [Rhodoferax sp.]
MGSKRAMLRNGLGELLSEVVPNRSRFFDLFCGAGSVSGYVASRFQVPVHACDLQTYAVALTASQIEQTTPFIAGDVGNAWMATTIKWLASHSNWWKSARQHAPADEGFSAWRIAVDQARQFCAGLPTDFPIARAYGGYYYSPIQAMTIDALRATLPMRHRTAALAALIDAASTCAAAPGHTAQPFSTKDSALPHLATAWARDVQAYCLDALARNASIAARVAGQTSNVDALELTLALEQRDIVFIDPPYSEVQYSRFYHVLESISRGFVGDVSGVGRYPALSIRPQSKFCRLTQSAEAFDELMLGVASSGAEAIVTFPAQDASNGLSGELVEAISDQYFKVKSKKITSLFSTLGGNSVNRHARQAATELVLHLMPR